MLWKWRYGQEPKTHDSQWCLSGELTNKKKTHNWKNKAIQASAFATCQGKKERYETPLFFPHDFHDLEMDISNHMYHAHDFMI